VDDHHRRGSVRVGFLEYPARNERHSCGLKEAGRNHHIHDVEAGFGRLSLDIQEIAGSATVPAALHEASIRSANRTHSRQVRDSIHCVPAEVAESVALAARLAGSSPGQKQVLAIDTQVLSLQIPESRDE